MRDRGVHAPPANHESFPEISLPNTGAPAAMDSTVAMNTCVLPAGAAIAVTGPGACNETRIRLPGKTLVSPRRGIG